MESITSSSNAQIKHLKELQSRAKARRETGTFVAEGRKLVEEACKLGLTEQIYLSESYAREQEENLTGLVEKANICRAVADSIFKTAKIP